MSLEFGNVAIVGDLDKSRLGSRSLIGQTSRKDEKEKNNK